jgi:UDP-N-acetylglucosamine--N-acetylmuramyl-(pentapeptide) pyrophosphoryl-undecaprenol N-acetylglucosamine transferase
MGGFAAGPGGVAARLQRRPLVIHEQNAIAGLTNRLLAPLASRVLAAFTGAFGSRPAEVTGNPLRPEIAALPPPAERFAGRAARLRLLVVGGSLGAAALNALLPQAIAMLSAVARPQVLHQAGERHADAARAAYAAAGVEAEIQPFLDDMVAAYAWADLVVCRSGALTVGELAAAGLPAILVPFPFAVDDHQTANARYLTDGGAALLAPQAALSAERLAGWLAEFAADAESGRARLLTMAESARALAHPDATAQVAAICLEEAGRES